VGGTKFKIDATTFVYFSLFSFSFFVFSLFFFEFIFVKKIWSWQSFYIQVDTSQILTTQLFQRKIQTNHSHNKLHHLQASGKQIKLYHLWLKRISHTLRPMVQIEFRKELREKLNEEANKKLIIIKVAFFGQCSSHNKKGCLNHFAYICVGNVILSKSQNKF